ncbi:hypothetical protein GYMLUDRAFT_40342 [Collybiopsis luxurians FD-317 M1]|uniref:Terpene synthase n=1 Tax=Collybiopsis luxurians FD-317 M1 TaxID=944289 RepID=A0A0D0CM27_9AGAR|nr:hypothetical protein GYMLUDRAFT_40342 [Collybiopsis luxurians FD-317 M1]
MSYQLPDLLSLFQSYHDLSINKHCRSASLSSEEWVRGVAQEVIPPSICSGLPGMKLGLLAACCFPSCDLNQLILVTDLWTLIMLDTLTVLRSEPPIRSHCDLPEDSKSDFPAVVESHILLKRLLPRLFRLRASMSDTWQQRFTASVFSYMDSRQKAINHRSEGSVVPLDIDDYIEFRRNLSGINIMLDLIEAVEGLELDIPVYNEELRTLRQLVGEIITITWDVFSYNVDQSIDNKLNIVSLLRSNQDIGLANAINEAGTAIRQRIDRFKSLENTLLASIKAASSQDSTVSGSTTSSSWFWSHFSSSTTPETEVPGPSITDIQEHDIVLHIRGLKDCMVGFLNWAYETDMFFGTKGESVKGFGWVFLLSPQSSVSSNGA